MRKLVYGTLALGAAMAVAFGANVKDASAATWGGTIEGDILNLTGGGNTVLVGTPSISAKGTDPAKVKVSSWDYYQVQNGKVCIDISKLAVNKANYLVVKSDFQSDAEAAIIEIPASLTLNAPKTVDKANGSFCEIKYTDPNAGSGIKDQMYAGNNLIYYTDSDFAENTVKKLGDVSNKGGQYSLDQEYPEDADGLPIGGTTYAMLNSGGSVYLREKGTSTNTKMVSGFTAYPNGLRFDGAATNMKCYQTAQRPSKAVKVSITKLANAPKLNVDYVNGTIKFAKNAECRVVGSVEHQDALFKMSSELDYDAEKDIYDVSDKTWTVGNDIELAKVAFCIDVRTAETTSGNTTKPASKWGRNLFNGQGETKLKAEDNADLGDLNYAEGDPVEDLVKAEFTWTNKGYDVTVISSDPVNAYKVEVLHNNGTIYHIDKSNKDVVIKSLAKAAVGKTADKFITAKKTAAGLGDLLAVDASLTGQEYETAVINKLKDVKLRVTKLGDKSKSLLPSTSVMIANDKIAGVYDNDTKWSFAIKGLAAKYTLMRTYKVGGKNAYDMIDVLNRKALKDDTVTISLSDIKPASNSANDVKAANLAGTKMADKTDDCPFTVIYKDSKTGQEKKIEPKNFTKILRGGTESDKNDVVGYSFKMPATNVTIVEATSDSGDNN